MFVCAQEILRKFDQIYSVKSFMMTLSEGPDANSGFTGICMQVMPDPGMNVD